MSVGHCLKWFWNLVRSRAELSRQPCGRMQMGAGWREPGLSLPVLLIALGLSRGRIANPDSHHALCECVHAHVCMLMCCPRKTDELGMVVSSVRSSFEY